MPSKADEAVMVPITQLPSIFTLGVLLLFANHAFADGVMFTCTGTKGYAVSVGGRSFSNKPVASAKGWVPLNDGSDTIKLSIRNKEWDI